VGTWGKAGRYDRKTGRIKDKFGKCEDFGRINESITLTLAELNQSVKKEGRNNICGGWGIFCLLGKPI